MSVMGSDEGETSKRLFVADRNELIDLHDCFHGFISKKEAETRLLESGIDGALLLRAEQNADLSKQKYTLSWLSPAHLTVMHYPITLVCGDCFLFGRPFPSLLDLIRNFIEQSDLPVLPLRPPSPVEITNRQRMAILPFNAMADSDELSFCEGDLLTELQQVDDQWIWARLEKNAQSGLVAVHLTIPLNDKRISPEELPYFHEGAVDELARRLNACGMGSYLIRTAMHQKSGYALMVNSGERIEKFLVCRLESGDFELGGRAFSTIPDIIDRYSRREICGTTKLVKAVLPAKIVKWKKPGEMALPKLQHLRSHSSCPHPVACAHAFRKNREDKWKTCYVMLSDVVGPQLFVFENEKRAKPKLVLDLCYCFVYKVDESVDDRPNCLHVQLNSFAPSSSAHLSFQTEADFLHWFSNLRARCFGCRYSSSPFAIVPNLGAMNSRLSTFIYMTIVAYRGAALRPDNGYSACVIVNSVRVVRTRPVAPSAKSCVSFETDFLIEHLPGGPCGLQLQLCCHNLLKCRQPLIKDTVKREISSTFTLPDNGTNLYVSADDCTEGFLFRAARHRLVVLPEEQYSSFFVLLTSHSFMLCQWTASQLTVFNRKHFARLLLSVLLPDHSVFFSFLDAIVDAQLQSEREETLFRGDSFCSCCVSTALHMIGRDLVVEELIPIVQQLHCERAPPVDAVAFVRHLSAVIARLPPLFVAIFTHVAEACRRRFPNAPYAPRRALSAFLVLRFINPILTFWKTSGGPARELAKSIQTAANQASSSEFSVFSAVGTSVPTDRRSAEAALLIDADVVDVRPVWDKSWVDTWRPAADFVPLDFTNHTHSAGEAVCAMVELMDTLVLAPTVDDTLTANPFVGYSKSEHLAMLAFHVDRVLQQRPTECPLSEAYTVLRLLKAHELRTLPFRIAMLGNSGTEFG